MTTEEKLKNFFDHSMESANTEAAMIIQKHEQALAQIFEDHKQQKLRMAAQELAIEEEKIKKEKNRVLSTEQLKIKREMTRKTQEIKEALFDNVKSKLMEFKKTPDYEPYLLEQIRKAAVYSANHFVHYYIDPSDADMIPSLQEKSGLTLEISNINFWGGIMATIPAQNLLIDYSFMSSFREEQESFQIEGRAI